MSSLSQRLIEAGDDLEAAVQSALSVLEQQGLSARDAGEFIDESVFNAWWGWDYGVKS